MRRSVALAAAGVVAVAFGWFVWPTPWAYHAVGVHLIRVNRFTGAVQSTDGTAGWESFAVELKAPPPAPSEPPTYDEHLRARGQR